MTFSKNFSYLICIFLCCITGAYCCNNEEVLCADGSKCIKSSFLCDASNDCSDGSDEDSPFCATFNNLTRMENCPDGQMKCEYVDYRSSVKDYQGRITGIHKSCASIKTACHFCSTTLNEDGQKLCKMITANGQLIDMKPPKTENKKNLTFEGILSKLSSAYNNQTFCNMTELECPPLYTRVADKCVSFFSVAEVTWTDAQHFCESIGGNLAILADLKTLMPVLQHLHERDLVGSFWVGGFYFGTKNWQWVDDTAMVMGAPFWAISNEVSKCDNENGVSTCDNRRCHKYKIRPLKSEAGSCVAISYDNHYYFSEYDCYESRSPLCIYA